MLSYEEKKALEIIKFLQDKCIQENGTGMMTLYRIDDLANAIKTLLNLIEKQSKEIEELKEKNKKLQDKAKELTSALLDSTPNDKIKATIEEYEDYGTSIYYGLRSNGKAFHQAVRMEVKEVLQSLLEKE